MSTYTWVIDSKDSVTRTMTVSYTFNGVTDTLNLPIPPASALLNQWIEQYAPVSKWAADELMDVTVGHLGQAEIPVVQQVDPHVTPETPNTVGNITEEYIRAIVYSVLDEIQQSQT